jgi:hypothetical protein
LPNVAAVRRPPAKPLMNPAHISSKRAGFSDLAASTWRMTISFS